MPRRHWTRQNSEPSRSRRRDGSFRRVAGTHARRRSTRRWHGHADARRTGPAGRCAPRANHGMTAPATGARGAGFRCSGYAAEQAVGAWGARHAKLGERILGARLFGRGTGQRDIAGRQAHRPCGCASGFAASTAALASRCRRRPARQAGWLVADATEIVEPGVGGVRRRRARDDRFGSGTRTAAGTFSRMGTEVPRCKPGMRRRHAWGEIPPDLPCGSTRAPALDRRHPAGRRRDGDIVRACLPPRPVVKIGA